MALSRVTTWSANDILTASALNGEFNNILNNPTSLISPLVANVDAGNFQLTNLTLDNETTTFSSGSEGRVAYRTDINRVQTYDGSSSQILPLTGDGVFNWTFNGDVEIWGAGAAAAPTGWTLVSGGSVARNSTSGQFKVGSYSAAVTSAGGSATRLDQTISNLENFGPAARWGSKTVTLGCWVRATSASVARIHIYDGTTRTYSSYHTGGSSLEFLTVTATLQANPTEVTVGAEVAAGGAAAQFDGFTFVVGPTVLDYLPSGWRGRKCIMSFDAGAGSSSTGDTTSFLGNGTIAGTEVGSSANVSQKIPFNCVGSKLYVCVENAAGVGETYTYVLRRAVGITAAYADTSITCTISGATAQDGADTTNQVALAAGDVVNVGITLSGGAATAIASATLVLEETP